MSRPEPPVPADLDLRQFPYMPLEVARLRDADVTLVVTAEAFRAAVLLWCAAWHQVPASSLPNDDRVLAKLAGFGRDIETWLGVRDDALRGFVECSDGRLYHSFIAEKALEAETRKRKQRGRTAAATAARLGKINGNRNDPRSDVRNEHQEKGKERNRIEKTHTSCESGDAPAKNAKGILVPPDWQPNGVNIEAAHNIGMTDAKIDAEVTRFRSYNRARGTLFTDLDAAWEGWCQLAKPEATAEPPPAPVDIDWDKQISFFAKVGKWPRGLGPEPGMGGCKCPKEILIKHGIDPATGMARKVDA